LFDIEDVSDPEDEIEEKKKRKNRKDGPYHDHVRKRHSLKHPKEKILVAHKDDESEEA
jgi:hypothetical protein